MGACIRPSTAKVFHNRARPFVLDSTSSCLCSILGAAWTLDDHIVADIVGRFVSAESDVHILKLKVDAIVQLISETA